MYLEAARYLMREAIRDDERHPATITVSHLSDSPNSIHLSQSDEIRRNLSQSVAIGPLLLERLAKGHRGLLLLWRHLARTGSRRLSLIEYRNVEVAEAARDHTAQHDDRRHQQLERHAPRVHTCMQ